MLRCKLNLSDNGVEVEMDGHAGAGAFGYDAVCGSASGLIVGFIFGLDAYGYKPFVCEVEYGRAHYKLDYCTDRRLKFQKVVVRAMFTMLAQGLLVLQEQNSNFLSVEIRQ